MFHNDYHLSHLLETQYTTFLLQYLPEIQSFENNLSTNFRHVFRLTTVLTTKVG